MCRLTPVDPRVDVTVCIVNWNGRRWLPECLDALRAVRGAAYEVIVVDNASHDGSADLVGSSYPQVKLIINEQNLGYAKGNNQAIRQGRGRYFLILNNDTAVYPRSLETLIRYLDQHPRAGMASGRLVHSDGSTQFMYYPVALPTLASISADLLWLNRLSRRNRLGRGALARHWDPEKPCRMEQIPGACMLVRREAFESFGLFDEDFELWYEDVDLCARCLRAGWEIWYVPDARVLHRGGASSKLIEYPARSALYLRNMLRYAERHFSRPRFLALKLMLALVLVLRLPLVLAASLVSWVQTEAPRGGALRSYLRLLTDVVRNAPNHGGPEDVRDR